jgi:hypothetical protein
MKFNTAKWHILSITRQRNKVQPTDTLNSNTLSNMESYPYLGVTITADLRWREHVKLPATKATRTLNFVGRNIYGCTPECKSLAYTSLVCPLMEYACLHGIHTALGTLYSSNLSNAGWLASPLMTKGIQPRSPPYSTNFSGPLLNPIQKELIEVTPRNNSFRGTLQSLARVCW